MGVFVEDQSSDDNQSAKSKRYSQVAQPTKLKRKGTQLQRPFTSAEEGYERTVCKHQKRVGCFLGAAGAGIGITGLALHISENIIPEDKERIFNPETEQWQFTEEDYLDFADTPVILAGVGGGLVCLGMCCLSPDLSCGVKKKKKKDRRKTMNRQKTVLTRMFTRQSTKGVLR